jgi:excisionase family DNA binding protein
VKGDFVMKWENSPDILTVLEAANLLRVGKNRMYEICKIDGFPRIVLGNERGIRIPKAALMRWIENRIASDKIA